MMENKGIVIEYNVPHFEMNSIIGPNIIKIHIGVKDFASLISRVHALMEGKSVELVRFRTENNPVEIRVTLTNEQDDVKARRLNDD